MYLRFSPNVLLWIGFLIYSQSVFSQIALDRPAMVKNINREPVSEIPILMGVIKGELIFQQWDPGSGWELWRTDGLEESASLLRDIAPGSANGVDTSSAEVAFLNEWMFFAADDGTHGLELWKTDGTTLGTQLVQDIRSGLLSAFPKQFKAFKGLLFFIVEQEMGLGVWVTDGTSQGTQQIRSFASSQKLSNFLEMNGALWFLVDGDDQTGLWKTDGTVAGSYRVVGVGGQSIRTDSFKASREKLYFDGFEPNQPGIRFLWASDGSTSGTFTLSSFKSLSDAEPLPLFFTFGNALFFGQRNSLWMTDGTTDGTVRLGGLISGNRPENLLEAGGQLFFSAFGGHPQIWKTDGSVVGTVRLQEFLPQNSDLRIYGENHGLVFFGVDIHGHGLEPWRSDGTAEGTFALWAGIPGAGPTAITDITRTANGYVFVGRDESGALNLWRTDGTTAGTGIIRAILPESSEFSAYAYGMRSADAKALWFVVDSFQKAKLWCSDGTEQGTLVLHEFEIPNPDSEPLFFETALGGIFFTVHLVGQGPALWRTDGTAQGTFQVGESNYRDYSFLPRQLVDCSGTLFFTSVGLDELWASDGTESGTRLVHSSSLETGTLIFSPLANVDGQLYYMLTSQAGPNGSLELWRSDGTENGTMFVSALTSRIVQAVAFHNELFFTTQLQELWKSDGTPEGTVLLGSFSSDEEPGSIRQLISSETHCFLTVLTGGNYEETLWATDGTVEGTSMIHDLKFPGGNGSFLGPFASLGPVLMFGRGSRFGLAEELWRTDGTAAGTSRLKSFGNNPGIQQMLPLKGEVIMVVSEDVNGTKLWKSDGTEAGTVCLKDRVLGADSFSPLQLTLVGDKIFFFVQSDDSSIALWKTDGTAAGTVLIQEGLPSLGLSEVAERPVGVGGICYFYTAVDPLSALTLWRSDGTASGTFPVPDPKGFKLSFRGLFQYPGVLVPSQGRVFLVANDGMHGFELWKIGDPDRDGNGLPDWWEDRYFGGKADPAEDPDLDGLNNWQESRADTDPTRRESRLTFSGIHWLDGRRLELRWPSIQGQEYSLLRSKTLNAKMEDATFIRRHIRATPPENNFLDVPENLSDPTFYRLVVE